MANIDFYCPKCFASIEVDEGTAGLTAPCPRCTEWITIPQESALLLATLLLPLLVAVRFLGMELPPVSAIAWRSISLRPADPVIPAAELEPVFQAVEGDNASPVAAPLPAVRPAAEPARSPPGPPPEPDAVARTEPDAGAEWEEVRAESGWDAELSPPETVWAERYDY
jgi:hypothetical protein